MTTAGRFVPMLAMLFMGMIGGAAASLLLGGGSIVLADEQTAAAVVTRAVHLADKEGHVRAIINLGENNEPEISLLNDKGKVVKRDKLIPPQESGLIAGLGNQFRIMLRDRSKPTDKGIELMVPDNQCLVLNPQVGFASKAP